MKGPDIDMDITTEQYIRKPLYVDAVRVNAQNFDDLAAWCEGEIRFEENPRQGTTKKYIAVEVNDPKNDRQTKAFIGDWLLYTEKGGYKVYTNKAFQASFDRVHVTNGSSEDVVITGGPLVNYGTFSTDNEGIASEEIECEQPVAVSPETQGVLPPVDEQEQREASRETRRIISEEEQRTMDKDEIQELLRSGEAVLAQDLV